MIRDDWCTERGENRSVVYSTTQILFEYFAAGHGLLKAQLLRVLQCRETKMLGEWLGLGRTTGESSVA